MVNTPNNHAGADLRVENLRISSQFIAEMNVLKAPLPWAANGSLVIDNDGAVVCEVKASNASEIAEMIVIATNTCGSFRATRR